MDKIRNRQQQPFFVVQNKLIDDGHLSRMGASSCAVYLCLCRHANTEHQCFPSYSKLQEETGFGRATVSKSLNHLIDLGYVRKLTIKRRQANIYEIMELPDFSGSEIELVQKLNQFKNETSSSSEIEPVLVQKLNSKKTKGKRLKEKDTHNKARASVAAANNSPDDLPSSKEAIAILGDKWEGFISHLVEESRTWTAYQSCSNDRARALKVKRVYLPNLFEKGELSNRCYLYLEDCSVSAPRQAQEDGLNPDYEYWDSLYEKDPLEVQKLAGHKIHHFLNWRQKQSAKVH